MITFKVSGDYSKTTKYLKKIKSMYKSGVLDEYGRKGVVALSEATPVESGETASSWSYDIIQNRSGIRIVWSNDNVVGGCNVAVLLQYGHATRNGGWVEGIDYINPTMQPIFEEIAECAWREVCSE